MPRRLRWFRVLSIVFFTALAPMQLLGQAPRLSPREEAIFSAINQIKVAVRLAALDSIQQQRLFTDVLGTTGASGTARALENKIFAAAELSVDDDARVTLDAVNVRIDAALHAFGNAPWDPSQPNAAQILNASLMFVTTVTRATGQRRVIKGAVNRALAELCGLYPIC